MLAFMPRSTLLLDSHIPNSTLERRTSITLLPSTPMSYAQSPLPAALPVSPSRTRKPTLSLNTSNVSPIFGKGATSLSLETLSATSPTSRNTFHNRNDGRSHAGAKTPKPVLTPLATNVELTTPDSPTPSQISLPDSADSTTDSSRSRTASVTSVSTVESPPPYELPFNATSILRNGPIPRSKSNRSSFSDSFPVLPAAKKVDFRAPLTEEVKTTIYTRRHSDIEESSTSTAVSEMATSTGGDLTTGSQASEADGVEPTISSPSRVKRDSDEIDDDSDSHATTPVAGRAKRHRWVWTLGPVQSAPLDTSSSLDGNEEERLHDS